VLVRSCSLLGFRAAALAQLLAETHFQTAILLSISFLCI
jgi:hypothetical protein